VTAKILPIEHLPERHPDPPGVRSAPVSPPRARSSATAGVRVRNAILWALLASVALTLAVFLHLSTALGRQAMADTMGPMLSSRIRGTARVGSVTRLDFDGIEMRDFTVTSPGGERVIAANRVETSFAYATSLEEGMVVMAPSVMEGGEMRITRGPEDQIDLVYAMEVPDDRFMPEVAIRDIRMQAMTMVFALPGVPGEVEMANVYGLCDMTLGHRFYARMDRVNGYVNIPVVHVGFNRLNGRITSDHATPLVVRMALDLEVAEPTMEIRYHAPATVAGGNGDGHLSIGLGADVPDERTISDHRLDAAGSDEVGEDE
jgi:hypothetical protein